MKRCDNGHYFNDDKHPICPFCGPGVSVLEDTYARLPPRPGEGDGQGSFEAPSAEPPAAPARGGSGSGTASNQETVAYWGRPGFDPIVGWLVCIEGTEKGQDFRIRRGNNSVGRDRGMDIVLRDPGVARHRQATIAYDKRTHSFMVKEGDSRGLVYLNGSPVAGAQLLQAWDLLEFGESQSKYLFLPLVGEEFQWQVDEEAERPAASGSSSGAAGTA